MSQEFTGARLARIHGDNRVKIVAFGCPCLPYRSSEQFVFAIQVSYNRESLLKHALCQNLSGTCTLTEFAREH